MAILEIHQMKCEIASRFLFKTGHLTVQKDEIVGLIGQNGVGKTSLLNRVLSGQDSSVRINGSIYFVPQIKGKSLTKSGGELTAEYLAKAFHQSADLLVIDEPTNNLDKAHIDWVIKEFQTYSGAILFVSHDRYLLNMVCDKIWEISEQKVITYSGNYDAYLEQKETERVSHQRKYERYRKDVQKLRHAIESKNQQAERAIKAPRNLSPSEMRIKGAKPHYAKVQKNLYQARKSIETRINQLEKVEKPKSRPSLKMNFPDEKKFVNKIVIRMKDLEGQVGNQILWQPATLSISGGDKIGIIGANGVGKTTFIKKLIENHSPHIYHSPIVKIGYFAQDLNLLDNRLSIIQNVRKDSIQSETLMRTILNQLGFQAQDIHKNISILSGGEKVKIHIAKLLVGDYNTLILDEPTNHLDIYALQALEEMLLGYQGTILLITHDQKMLKSIATKIITIKDKRLDKWDMNYDTYLNRHQKCEDEDIDIKNELLLIENKIAQVMSELVHDPNNEELDQKFQKLIRKKNFLVDR